MSIGGAIAGGSRLAIAREFEPETFWEEVRRYGITVASYTWTMLREIADAPEDPAEHHHPVRLFIGAGHAARALAPGRAPLRTRRRVLEFYASTEGEAILVNLSGEKPGCKGRPLPGSAEVRLAAYDVAAGRLREREDGFAVECRPGEVGMLLTRLRGVVATSESPLRGLFEPDDAWLATGDLFRARRGRRPLAGRPRRRADPHGSTATSPPSRSSTRSAISTRSISLRSTASRPPAASARWRSRRSPRGPGSSSTRPRSPTPWRRSSRRSGPTWSTSSTRSP